MSDKSQRTILLVEDEVISSMAGKITLEKYGNKVMTAYSGEEAVDTVDKTPAIDLVLMDINLGAGIDGTEAAEIILKSHDLPVVFLSGHMEAEVVGRTEKITSYGYIVKSSSSNVLDASIKMAFKLFEAKTREKEKESQREAALEALRESEARYRTLFENTGTAIIVIEEDATISLVNDETLHRTGYERSEIVGKKKWTEIVDGEDLERMLAQHRLRRENPGEALPGYEFRFRTKSGELRYALINVQLIPGTRKSMASLVDITERKLAESQMKAALAALRESEDRYRDLVENSQDLICTHDLEGKILSTNEPAARLTGYPPEDLLKMNMAELLQPEVRHLFKAYLAEIQAKGWSRGTMRIQTASGEPRYWEYYNTLRTKGVAVPIVRGLGHDITERERTEKALRESEERQQLILATLPVAIFTSPLDPAVDVSWVSGDMEKVTGFTVDEYMAEKDFWRNRLHADDRERVLAAYRDPAAYDEIVLEYQWLCKDGNYKWFYDHVIKKHSQQGAQYFGIILDISERKRAEEESKRQLAEKVTLLKEVHHRIKNNIASIAGLLSLQAQAVTNPEAGAVLHDAIGRVVSMQILYDQLLLTESYKDSSAKDYVEGIATSVVALFPGDVQVTIDRHIADFLLDPKQLSPLGIIINELLTNIMKHAFAGREKGTITICLARAGDRVTLTVQDNGRGLPAGFDLEKSKGLGLMLVKMLSQQLGGSFSLAEQKGTRCTVVFDA